MRTVRPGPIHDERLARVVDRLRIVVPVLTCVAALYLMASPLMTPGPSMPHLALLSVLAWSSFQPNLIPPYVAFALGIMTDAALGIAIGVNATLLPLLTVVIGALERRFGHRSYVLDWLAAGLIITAYQYLSWQLLRFVTGDLPFSPLIVQAVTTVLAYPIAVAAIARIQRRWGVAS